MKNITISQDEIEAAVHVLKKGFDNKPASHAQTRREAMIVNLTSLQQDFRRTTAHMDSFTAYCTLQENKIQHAAVANYRTIRLISRPIRSC